MAKTSLENQLDLAERVRKRWQPEKREDSAVYYGPLIDADKTYEGARNDVLDLFDVVDALQAELAACQAMTQRVATESGDSVAWALKMGVQNGSINLEPTSFQGWDNGCDCAECRPQRVVYDWLFGEASGKGGEG